MDGTCPSPSPGKPPEREFDFPFPPLSFVRRRLPHTDKNTVTAGWSCFCDARLLFRPLIVLLLRTLMCREKAQETISFGEATFLFYREGVVRRDAPSQNLQHCARVEKFL